MNKSAFPLAVLIILSACHAPNLLTYKHKRFYSEKSIIVKDSMISLEQTVYYDKPNSVDEEFFHDLSLWIVDTIAAKSKKRLNLETDIAILQADYRTFSVWNWSAENNKVTGTVNIISWSNDRIKLKENVVIYDYKRDCIIRFKGKRVFTPESPLVNQEPD
ncbi:MAG: hypothetical protein R3A50_01395 [Saprospiraceae bacterium]